MELLAKCGEAHRQGHIDAAVHQRRVHSAQDRDGVLVDHVDQERCASVRNLVWTWQSCLPRVCCDDARRHPCKTACVSNASILRGRKPWESWAKPQNQTGECSGRTTLALSPLASSFCLIDVAVRCGFQSSGDSSVSCAESVCGTASQLLERSNFQLLPERGTVHCQGCLAETCVSTWVVAMVFIGDRDVIANLFAHCRSTAPTTSAHGNETFGSDTH